MYDGYDSRKELVIIDLHDFQIYRSPELGHEGRRYELTSLHHLERPRAKKLCFDGFLCLSNIRYYVCSVPIADSSIEGYGDHEDPQVVSYVQSELARKDGYQFDIWYRLNKPTPNYQRFYDPFLWVAQLGKHVLDYMDEAPARSVRLDSFRQEFHGWLTRRFAQNNDFQRWHSQFRRQVDFRNGVNAYIEYICLQAANLPNPNQLLGHPLWGECMARGSTIIKQQELVIKNTIATPDVYKLFKNMYFGNCLLKQRPENLVELEQARRKRRLGFPDVHTVSTTHRVCHPYGTSPVRVGDVVALDPDAKDRTLWRSSDLEWLAYVQAIEALENGTQRLSVLWLYRPRETNISKAKYLFDNELFFSDNCNCTERKLLSTDVKGRYDIAWSPSTINKNGRFFIRQTYITQESAFVTFTKEHNTCVCRKKKTSPVDSYRPGDTAYLRTSNKELIDPVLIININRATGFVTVRKLLRLGRDCSDLAIKAHRSNVAPNELVLSDEYEDVSAVRIQQRCFVKFVSKLRMLKDNVPFPYNQNGAGHLWFLSMGLLISNNNRHLMFLRALPSIFHEGPDIALDQKLKGVSIFSGGGSLDRGLEEGGAVEFHTAVDISPEACHTQLANAKDPVNIRIYCGSVDDYINAALAGSKSQLIARIGDVDFIAAGSPCPGKKLQRKVDVCSWLMLTSCRLLCVTTENLQREFST
jgi:DNA (cytosine-5)-methyltransferase 1